MKYFDMSETVEKHISELEAMDPAALENKVDPDPLTGPARIAALLTWLPEEKRKTAVEGFVRSMLND